MFCGKRIIALCTSRVYDDQVNEFIDALNGYIVQKGYRLFVYSINNDMYWEEQNINAGTAVYSLIDYDITDAVVIMDEKIKSRTVSDNIAETAHSHGVPVIVVDGKMENSVNICFDYEKGFENIVRHVMEVHHAHKPHFMAGLKDNPFSDKRIDIFKRVIAEYGIDFNDNMLSYGDFWAKPAAEAARRIAESGDLPDAVICANDIMAINVCGVFMEKGIKVPEQVIVTGFDGIAEINLSSPKISSVKCGSVPMAKAVSDALTDCFENGVVNGLRPVLPTLIPNASCGCHETEATSADLGRMNSGLYRYQDDMRLMFNVAELIHMSDSPEKAAACMHNYLMDGVCCIVNKSFLCREKDYFSDGSGISKQRFEDERILLYDSYTNSYDIEFLEKGRIVPDLRRLAELPYPINFCALTYLDFPIGYICFSYQGCDMTDYAKVFQITTSLGIGLGGFLTRHHQQYLNEKVEEVYKNDYLTGLLNRNGFFARLNRYIAERSFYGQPVSVISADLDGLKSINDNFGHDAGDLAISTVAKALKNSCPENSLCVRSGGDEMTALVFGENSTEKIISGITERLEKFNENSCLGYKVRASIGCFTGIFDGNFNFETASKIADEEMYRNKQVNKDHIPSEQ